MISVIIPTLNAQKYIEKLIDKLKAQKLEQELEIIVIDSASDDKTAQIARDAGVRVLEINRDEFDHGGTRNLGWRSAKGEIICFMTQDALPVDDLYLANLIQGFEDNDVVMISGRQVPKSDVNYVERLTRAFNYPAISNVRSQKDIQSMGIKAYFFSDVCAASRRSFLEETGGFDSPIISNEDMLLAAKALQAGYRVRYEAKAEVYHSHNCSLRYQYCGNFDVAVFMEMYKDIVKGDGTTGEGIRMVLYTEKELFLHLHFVSMFRCVFESAAKGLGKRGGRRYRSLSKEKIMKRTSNPVFWKSNDIFNH